VEFDIVTDSVADWPPYLEEKPAAWRPALEELQENQRKLVAALRAWPDEQLYDTVPRRPFSFAFLVNGLIQHDVYHLGQIALLRKLL